MAADDIQKQIHRGYLVQGDELRVDGGFTLDFPKRNKWYFCLQKIDNQVIMLQGFKDDSIFKKRRSSTTTPTPRERRKMSKASMSGPCYTLTTTVKVHTMDICIGRKTTNVIILLHGTLPLYFKTLKEKDLREWTKAFGTVSRIMDNRSTEKLPSPSSRSVPDIVVTEEYKKMKENRRHSSELDNSDESSKKNLSLRPTSDESGFASNSSSPRSSTGSDQLPPPSPTLLPLNIQIEPDDDDDTLDPGIREEPTERQRKAENRKSIIIKRRQRKNSSGEFSGKYDFTAVEIPVDEGPYDSTIRKSVLIDSDDDDDYDAPVPRIHQAHSDRLAVPKEPGYDKLRRGRDFQPPLPIKTRKMSDPNPPRLYPEQLVVRPRTMIRDDESPPPLPARPRIERRTMSVDQGVHDYMNMPSINNRFSRLLYEQRPLPEPQEDDRRDIEYLKWEKSKSVDGLVITFSREDLYDTLALATIGNGVWIAGWKRNANLYGQLHIGDKLCQVNDQNVETAEWAQTCIKSAAHNKLSITISRLPNAELLELTRIDPSIQWGIEVSKNEVKDVKNGPALYEGLKPTAQCVLSKNTCRWVITEINHSPVPLVIGGQRQNLVKEQIEKDSLKLPIVAQPQDFVSELVKNLLKLKHNSQYFVG